MGAAFPRPLSDRERSLLELLLAENFPGADELRAQARAVRAKGLWEDRASILLLEVTDPNAPRANVVHTVPVETKCGTPNPLRNFCCSSRNVFCDSGAARLRPSSGQLSRAWMARSWACNMSRCDASAESARRNLAAWIAAPTSPRRS